MVLLGTVVFSVLHLCHLVQSQSPVQIGEIEQVVTNQRSSLQSVNFASDRQLIQVIRNDGSYFYPVEDINLDHLLYFAKGQSCPEKKVYVLESTADDEDGAGGDGFRKIGRKPIRVLLKGNWMEESHRIFHLSWIYYNTIEHRVEWTRDPSYRIEGGSVINPITDNIGEIIGQLICSSIINCNQDLMTLEVPSGIPPILMELERVRIFTQKSQGMKRDYQFWSKSYPQMYENQCDRKWHLDPPAKNNKVHHLSQEVKDLKHLLKLECTGDDISEVFSTYLNQIQNGPSQISNIEYFLRYNCKLSVKEEGVFFTRFFLEILNQVQGEALDESVSNSASCTPSTASLLLGRIVLHTIKILRESRSCHLVKIVDALRSFIQKRIGALREMSSGQVSSTGCRARESRQSTIVDDDTFRDRRSPVSITTLYSTSRIGRATATEFRLGHDWNCDLNLHGSFILILGKFEEIMFGPEVKLQCVESSTEETPTVTIFTSIADEPLSSNRLDSDLVEGETETHLWSTSEATTSEEIILTLSTPEDVTTSETVTVSTGTTSPEDADSYRTSPATTPELTSEDDNKFGPTTPLPPELQTTSVKPNFSKTETTINKPVTTIRIVTAENVVHVTTTTLSPSPSLPNKKKQKTTQTVTTSSPDIDLAQNKKRRQKTTTTTVTASPDVELTTVSSRRRHPTKTFPGYRLSSHESEFPGKRINKNKEAVRRGHRNQNEGDKEDEQNSDENGLAYRASLRYRNNRNRNEGDRENGRNSNENGPGMGPRLRSRQNRNRFDNRNGRDKEQEQHSKENLHPSMKNKHLKTNVQKGRSANKDTIPETQDENTVDEGMVHEMHHVQAHHFTTQEHEGLNVGSNGRHQYHAAGTQSHDDIDMGLHTDTAPGRRNRAARQRRAIENDLSGTLTRATGASNMVDFLSYIQVLLEGNCEEIENVLPSEVNNGNGIMAKVEESNKLPSLFGTSLQAGCLIPDDFEQKKVELAQNLDDALKFVLKQREICKDS